MQVGLKSVFKTSSCEFETFEDHSIIFRAANTLCIKEIGRSSCQFICLHRHLDALFSFKPSANRKAVFTAERIGKKLYIAHYTLSGERKVICLTDESNFFQQVEGIQLLVDEYESNLCYAVGRGKETSCVLLADIHKNKVLAMGFMPHVEGVKINSRENMALAVCGHNGSYNYLKYLRYGAGQWEIEEVLYKHIQGVVFQHELSDQGRVLMATRTALFVYQDNQLLQTIEAQPGQKIEEFLKVPHGLIMRLSNQSLNIYVEDSDEVTLLPVGQIKIDLFPTEGIKRMQLNLSNDEVVLRTDNNNLYVWSCEHLDLSASKMELAFSKVENACPIENEGAISMSRSKKYCLFCGPTNVTLWNIDRNELMLNSEYVDPRRPGKRQIFAGAISPDGNSFMLAFEDRVKMFKILFTKYKYFGEVAIKRCQQIVYSNGGQLVACRYGRSVNTCVALLSADRLVEVDVLKIQAEAFQLVWSALDDALYVSTDFCFVQTYRISNRERINNLSCLEPVSAIHLDYKTDKLLVSTQKGKVMVADGNTIVDTFVVPVADFDYIFPLYGMYFAASRTGVLYWSSSIKFERYKELALFTTPFSLICKSGCLIAYSSFCDVIALRCTREDSRQRILSSEDIVQIEKDEVLGLFQRIKLVEGNFDMLQSATQVKLEQERSNYQQALSKFVLQFREEISFANSKLAELSLTKAKQQREHEDVFSTLQSGQMRNVQEIERMYERKCAKEKAKVMELEQSKLQLQNHCEKLILKLEKQYHQEVAQIREQYSMRLMEDRRVGESVKSNNLQEKTLMHLRIIDLEEENDVTLMDMQRSKDIVIDNLRLANAELSELYEKVQIEKLNLRNEFNQFKEASDESMQRMSKMAEKLSDSENRVKLMESELTRKNKIIEEKNSIISEQGQQISGLQKAKYVLSFRTTEIRKELQPKQALVDKLKGEMLKLSDEFKEEKRKNFNFSQKIQKLQVIYELAKRENSDLKIGLKCKEQQYDELCSELFDIMNTVNPKDWNAHLIKLYQTYLKQDSHKLSNARKKNDTSEQINRHLIHVEESLIHVTSGAERALRERDKEVIKKMKENSQLVFELNAMRKDEDRQIREKKELLNQNARLKRNIEGSFKNPSRTVATGLTRRVVTATNEGLSREKTMLLEFSSTEVTKRDEYRSTRRDKNRIASAHKTLMTRNQTKEKSTKFFSIAKQLQSAKDLIRRQDRMIEELNQRLLGLPDEPVR